MTPHKLPRKRRFSPADFLLFAFFSAALVGCACLFAASQADAADQGLVVRIYDQHAGTVYAEAPAHVGSRLFFGWIHSLEKIPWHEYYLVDEKGNLELQAIAFPAFGAGIPADAGRVCFVRDGLIHMEEIGQVFTELLWLNSHTATQDILLDGAPIARGADLPHHAKIVLRVEKGKKNGTP